MFTQAACLAAWCNLRDTQATEMKEEEEEEKEDDDEDACISAWVYMGGKLFCMVTNLFTPASLSLSLSWNHSDINVSFFDLLKYRKLMSYISWFNLKFCQKKKKKKVMCCIRYTVTLCKMSYCTLSCWLGRADKIAGDGIIKVRWMQERKYKLSLCSLEYILFTYVAVKFSLHYVFISKMKV